MDDMRDGALEIGDQVIFLGHNEWQVAWGDCDETVGILEPEATYQIREIEEHSWHTKIRLVDFNGKGFNSCMFKLAEPESELKPCPFCGGEVKILVSDGEGNIRDEEYETDPWSGLGYQLAHYHEDNENCPIAKYKDDDGVMGVFIYDSREEAIEAWNRRVADADHHNLVKQEQGGQDA